MKGNHRHETDGLCLRQAAAFKAAVMPAGSLTPPPF